MELDSIDPTSATLLDRVGLSPNDEVASAQVRRPVRLQNPGLVPAVGLARGRLG